MMYRLSEARKVLSVDSVSTCKCWSNKVFMV